MTFKFKLANSMSCANKGPLSRRNNDTNFSKEIPNECPFQHVPPVLTNSWHTPLLIGQATGIIFPSFCANPNLSANIQPSLKWPRAWS